MKQLLLASAVLALTWGVSSAHAGTYSDAVDKQRHCAIEGEMGAEVYSKNSIFGKTLKEHAAASARGELPKAALEDIAVIFITVRAARISSQKDAYMMIWADCMDKKN